MHFTSIRFFPEQLSSPNKSKYLVKEIKQRERKKKQQRQKKIFVHGRNEEEQLLCFCNNYINNTKILLTIHECVWRLVIMNSSNLTRVLPINRFEHYRDGNRSDSRRETQKAPSQVGGRSCVSVTKITTINHNTTTSTLYCTHKIHVTF